MVTQANIRGGQQGVTLIELMIGALVATTIIAAGYAVLTSSSKAMTTNEQTVETQQNVRVAMEFLYRDIRQAGFGMNGPVGNCPTAIVPADHTPTGPDQPGGAGGKYGGNRYGPGLDIQRRYDLDDRRV